MVRDNKLATLNSSQVAFDHLTERDLPACMRLSIQAGWNQIEADWRRLIYLWPEGCFGGRLDGQLVATATIAGYGCELGWVGMVLVDEMCRGKGVGGAMLDVTLAAGLERQFATIGLDASDLGRPVYLRRGLREEAIIERWVRGAEPIASGASDRIRINDTSDIRRIVELDLAASGVDRSRLVGQLMRESGASWVTIADGDVLQGYALSRPGRTARHLGPVVAVNESVAVRLIHAMVSQSPASHIIDVPAGRTTGLMAAMGWTQSRRLTRMLIGKGSQVLLAESLYAGAGFEYG